MKNNSYGYEVVFEPEPTQEEVVPEVETQETPSKQVSIQQSQEQQPKVKEEASLTPESEYEVVYSPEENIYPPHKTKEIQKNLRDFVTKTPAASTRIGANTFNKLTNYFSRGVGSVLEGLSKIGVEPEEGKLLQGKGTELMRAAGKWLQKDADLSEAELKGKIDEYLGKPTSSLEESFTELGDRTAKLYSYYPDPKMFPLALLGGVGGQIAKEFDASPETQQKIELATMIGPDLLKYMGKQIIKNIEYGSYTAKNFWKGASNEERKSVVDAFKKVYEKVFSKTGESYKSVKDFFKINPEALGKVTGLKGDQLEAFNTLVNAEDEAYNLAVANQQKQINELFKDELKAGEVGEGAIENIVETTEETTGKVSEIAGERVTAAGEDLKLEPSDRPIIKQLTEEEKKVEGVLQQAHPNSLGNFREKGQVLKQKVLDEDQKLYDVVNKLYDKSRKLNKTISAEHPELVKNLVERYKELKKIPKRSSVQNQLLDSIEEILPKLAKFKNGNIRGQILKYKKINNQVMIDQVQSLRQVVDFDFAHGNPTGIFKPTIKEIQQSAYEAAFNIGNADAAETLNEAQTTYKKWTDKFNNPDINPYRDLTNKNYEAFIKKNIDNPDHFNIVNDIVGKTKEGKNVIGGVKRERIENALSKFIDNPILVKSRDYRRALKSLESTLSPAELKAVDVQMNKLVPKSLQERSINIIDKHMTAFKKDLKAAQKYSNKTPAEIRRLNNLPEGVPILKKDLSATKNGKELFDKIAKGRIDSMLRGGNLTGIPTGEDVAKILNIEENYALFEAYTSPEIAAETLSAAQKLAKSEWKVKNLKKLGKTALKFKAFHWIFL